MVFFVKIVRNFSEQLFFIIPLVKYAATFLENITNEFKRLLANNLFRKTSPIGDVRRVLNTPLL